MAYIEPNGEIRLLKCVPLDKEYKHTFYFENINEQIEHFLEENVDPANKKYQVPFGTFTKQSYQRESSGVIRLKGKADNYKICNYMLYKNTGFSDKWFFAFIDSVEYVNNNTFYVYYTEDILQTWYFDYELSECFVEREHTETDKVGEHLVPENLNGEMTIKNRYEFTFPDSVTPPNPDQTLKPYEEKIMWDVIIFYVVNKEVSNSDVTRGVGITNINYDEEYNEGVIKPITSIELERQDPEPQPIPSNPDYTNFPPDSTILNGIYSGALFVHTPISDRTAKDLKVSIFNVDTIIYKLIQINASIIDIYQVPHGVIDAWETGSQPITAWRFTHTQDKYFYSKDHELSYLPKNNKIYTSQFVDIMVTNNNGSSQNYDIDKFWGVDSGDSGEESNLLNGGKVMDFGISATPVPSPELTIFPQKYEGIEHNYELGVMLTDFPKCVWSIDTAEEWWAQNKERYALSVCCSAIKLGGSFLAGQYLSSLGNIQIQSSLPASTSQLSEIYSAENEIKSATQPLIKQTKDIGLSTARNTGATISNLLDNTVRARNTPDQSFGQLANSTINIIQNRIGFYIYEMGVEYNTAISIDNFFSMFGYAIKRIKMPNIQKQNAKLRPSWNYIKTAGCIIHPKQQKGLPSSAESVITAIYDNGITFWNKDVIIGDYSLDNKPIQ